MREVPAEAEKKGTPTGKAASPASNPPQREAGPDKAYRVEAVREQHQDAYKPWTEALDLELTRMYYEGVSARDMAKHFGRTKGAIQSRIKKLELEALYG